MKLWSWGWNNQLERVNLRLGEDNEGAMGMGKGGISKVQLFSSNEFWKNIGCLISDPTFSVGRLNLC